MKKTIATVMAFFMFGGVVAAASINGNFEGNPIVKVKSNNKEVLAEDTPAINYNGRTLVPIYLLKKLGLEITWNAKDYSVDVKMPKAGDMKETLQKLKKFGGTNVHFEVIDSKYYVFCDLEVDSAEEVHWEDALQIMDILSETDAERISVRYVDEKGWIGSVTLDKSVITNYREGKITHDVLIKSREVSGSVFLDKLSSVEIAKLAQYVGFVEAYDDKGTMLGTGSGFFVGDGLFFTNDHVAGEAANIRVKNNGKTYENEGWWYFKNTGSDVWGTVLSTKYDKDGNATGETPKEGIDYTVRLPEIGEKVYAIGNPNGLENTVTDGIVSAIRKLDDGITYIQHTAETEPGSSGGVLLNEYGQAIGITTSGVPNTNIEFAVPMMYVEDELEK